MKETDLAAKERIIQATIALLNEEADPDKLTVRRIAERAEVGVGTINYHFQTKENLLNQAVGLIMREMAAKWTAPQEQAETDPVARLRNLLKETSEVAFQFPALSRIAISHALMQGNMEPALLTLPMLREIYGAEKSETELRLIAFTLITATQVIFLRAPAFQLYAGIDFFDQQQREASIDILIDNLVTI